MISEAARRTELHNFLRAARARLQPEDIGIKPAPNRRGSGLRQSDVAAALVVSGRWYNGFENGACSAARIDGLLDKLTRILRLTPAERVHMYLLATGHEPAPATVGEPRQASASQAVLERLISLAGPDLPALVCDIAWNVLARNQAMTDRIADPAPQAEDRNVILWLFTPEAERIIGDVSHTRGAEIGQVHLALARHPGDPRLEHLLARLRQVPEACRLWDRHHISEDAVISPRRVRARGSKAPCTADLLSLEFPGGLRLLVLVPRASWPAVSRPGQRPSGPPQAPREPVHIPPGNVTGCPPFRSRDRITGTTAPPIRRVPPPGRDLPGQPL
jgi:hypothetical protein